MLAQALIAIPAGAYYATVPVMLSEMFPINLRCTVLSVLYSTAASFSAGLAPVVSLILLQKTNNAASPSILVFALASLVFLAIYVKKIHLKSRYLLPEREA